MASRMETTGIPKGTHVTREVYQLLKDTVDFTPCGLTFVKGKGELETYLHMSTPAPMGRLTHNGVGTAPCRAHARACGVVVCWGVARATSAAKTPGTS